MIAGRYNLNAPPFSSWFSGCGSSGRSHSGNGGSSNGDGCRETDDIIPPPTWSIASLELEKDHDVGILSDDEYRRLAKLALLDIRKISDKQLKQDLANMMHMIQQVQQEQDDEDTVEEDDDSEDTAIMYDIPRGVTSIPFRNDDDTTYRQGKEESKQVWESYLKPHTKQIGGHSYFVITTKEQEQSKSKK